MLARRTQTNEAGPVRAACCPLLAALPQPLALLEVGASAGCACCPIATGTTTAATGSAGPPCSAATPRAPRRCPSALPEVVWRAGMDLNPLDVTDPDDGALAGA